MTPSKKKTFFKAIKMISFFTVVFYTSSLVAFRTVYFIAHYFIDNGLTELSYIPKHIWPYISATVYISVGCLFTAVALKVLILPIYRIYTAIDKVSEGDYSVKIKPEGIKTIRKLSKRFNKMTEELNSVETMRNDFINDFSHEFKTPIVSIEGFAKILKNDDSLTEKEKEEYLNIIISESSRLAELSTKILSLSKIEKQTLLTDKTTFNVSEQIRLAIIMLDTKWQDKSIEFDCSFDEIYVNGNKEMLRQLWINILDNAIKFSPKNGKVEISITQTDNAIIFAFKDNGTGMSENTISHIFDKFYQGDSSHSTIGNGIGLPIAKKICDLHNGTIEIKSALNEGSTFTITLPKE